MKMTFSLFIVAVTSGVAASVIAQDPTAAYQSPRRRASVQTTAPTRPLERSPIETDKIPDGAIPPLPEGVAELKFGDLFKMPVGPLGLEFTDRVQALNGRKVRILGYQVAEAVGLCNAEPNATDPKRKARAMLEASVPGRLLLAATPQTVNINHYGLCEDLPPAVVYVTVPEYYGQILPQHPGLLLLTGTLEIGNKQEPDGRVSAVRLKLDPQSPTSSTLTPQSSPAVAVNQDPKNNNTTK